VEVQAVIHLQVCHSVAVDDWLTTHHYLHSTPAGAVIRLFFVDDAGNKIGAMMWGRNTSTKQNNDRTLTLTRMHFIDDTEPYIESRCLAMARKYIRKSYPRIHGLIAYSSTGQGHEGTVYRADGWFEVSKTRENSRDCRPGRKNIDTSSKIKWVRSV
jgi:hypothetical protein